MNRRRFFQVFGAGIAVGVAREPEAPQSISAWIHIAADSTISVYCGKCEMGQNIRTSLAQAVAEELRAPLDSVHMVLADTALTPYDPGTFSSRTTPFMAPQLRMAAAAARELLIELAAARMHFDPQSLEVEEGEIRHATSGTAVSFGRIARGEKLLKVIRPDVALRPAADWTIAGTPAPKTGAIQFVTGGHRFPSDTVRPGMLYGKVLRPPSYGASLVSVEADEGITLVRDGDFAGVTAPDSHAAECAVAALRAQWKASPQPSSAEFTAAIKAHAAPGAVEHSSGSLAEGFRAAAKKFEGAYRLAFIAHAPLEPRAAVAEWTDGNLTVWAGTTSPFGVRSELAKAFAIPEEKVRVIVPDAGGGFCGKSRCEAAMEAARLAKAAGRPVKIVWTREEEFTWAWFRPAGLIEIASGVREDGTFSAWEFHNYNSGVQAIRTPYEVANQRIEFHSGRSPLRQGSYRALAAVANFFARETHLDEVAVDMKLDPLELRRRNTRDPRLGAVFEAAAQRFGWGRKAAARRGCGIAGGFEKGAYVATCAEVAVSGDQVKVTRVVTAYDCGAVINPNHLTNQVEGGTVMAIGGALLESIEAENGRIANGSFSRYRVPRFGDAPAIDVVLIDRKEEKPFGAGETPMCAVAPAIGNAIHQACGVRLRSMPLRLKG